MKAILVGKVAAAILDDMHILHMDILDMHILHPSFFELLTGPLRRRLRVSSN